MRVVVASVLCVSARSHHMTLWSLINTDKLGQRWLPVLAGMHLQSYLTYGFFVVLMLDNMNQLSYVKAKN